MEDIYEYIETYDELVSFIKEYQEKKVDNQVLNITVTKNEDHNLIDVELQDLKNDTKDIKTKVLAGKFDYYVLPRIVIRYSNWYVTDKEKITKINNEYADYTNISTVGDKIVLKNYPIVTINYMRKLLD